MWKQIVLGSLHLFSDSRKGQTFRNTGTGHNFAHNYHDYFPQLAAVLFMWCDRAPKLAVMCDRVLALCQTYFYSSVNQNTSCIIHSNDCITAVFYLFEEKQMSFRQNRPQGSSKKYRRVYSFVIILNSFTVTTKVLLKLFFSFWINVSVYQCFYFFVKWVSHHVF